MNFDYFANHPFVQSIAQNDRWTASTKTKMPIDMNRLRTKGIIIGASFADGNQPLVTLPELIETIPDATNAAYNLKQALDKFFIVDIEPECPADVRDELLRLPYTYGELSMSGRGFHLVFERPDPIPVKRPELFSVKPAVKHPGGWFEFLFNHYVTFTGNAVVHTDPSAEIGIERLWEVFDEISENTKILTTAELTGEIPDLEEIELGEFIVDLLSDNSNPYRKTVDDFNGDTSKYEFGIAGFYNKRLNSLLSTTAYEDHDYTPEERTRLLYEIITRMTPYREKHETVRDGLPWLLYTAKRVVTSVT